MPERELAAGQLPGEAEEGSSLTIAQQLKEAGYKWKPV